MRTEKQILASLQKIEEQAQREFRLMVGALLAGTEEECLRYRMQWKIAHNIAVERAVELYEARYKRK